MEIELVGIILFPSRQLAKEDATKRHVWKCRPQSELGRIDGLCNPSNLLDLALGGVMALSSPHPRRQSPNISHR
jgi:hypothetical protein